MHEGDRELGKRVIGVTDPLRFMGRIQFFRIISDHLNNCERVSPQAWRAVLCVRYLSCSRNKLSRTLPQINPMTMSGPYPQT